MITGVIIIQASLVVIVFIRILQDLSRRYAISTGFPGYFNSSDVLVVAASAVAVQLRCFLNLFSSLLLINYLIN